MKHFLRDVLAGFLAPALRPAFLRLWQLTF